MSAAVTTAQARHTRFYKLTYECHGEEWIWSGTAASLVLADLAAKAALSEHNPGFNRYKAVQVTAEVSPV